MIWSVEMIKDLMAQSEITSDQLSDYLYAKHAPERNAYVASKNPDNKAGSGQTDIWAAQTVRELETPEMKRVAGLVYSITPQIWLFKWAFEIREPVSTNTFGLAKDICSLMSFKMLLISS